jgi:hypothetical protein
VAATPLWQIKTTLAHGRGRAALLRRLLAVADQQVSPTGLAALPDWQPYRIGIFANVD